ncbi:MAG: hypothetical protein M3Y50_16330 [Acidobacteriota bacterium]|nr:hypothetical protein [Acidobacteriota bacterium]
MHTQQFLKPVAALALALMFVSGCKSKQDEAVDKAKQQAAATGQAQQVVSVDKDGNTTTTTVQPPVPGQSGQAVTTTVTPAAGVGPNTVSSGPVGAAAPAVQGGYGPGAPAVAGGYPAGAPAAAAPVSRGVAGGDPVIRPADVEVPAGTSLAIRINQHISVKTSRAGDRFDGELVDPVVGSNDRVIVPKGTPVGGIIDASHKRGHFKGASILELRLTSMTLNGTRYPLDTRDLTRTKKGKGKRTAAFIGGGAGLGMLIGGIASGGTGLLIGGLAGGGAGTAVGALTGNRDIEIPAESIVRFRLADDLVLRQ